MTQSQSPCSVKRKTHDFGDGDDQTTLANQNSFVETSSPVPKKKRAPRPQYTKEQEDFIWFCRDDLSMSWRKVVELYNNHWHPFEVEPNIRSESGLQSRYYRILDFPVKIRKKKEPSRPDLGLIPSTQRRYPWMGVIKAGVEEKKNVERNFRYNITSLRMGSATEEGRDNEADDEDGLSSEVEEVKRESDCSERAQPRPRTPQYWSGTESTSTRPHVILHTSETESEAEPEQEWEKPRSLHEKYGLKVLYYKFLSCPSHWFFTKGGITIAEG